MRLPILAATAALMVGPVAAQPRDAPPTPPWTMRDTPLAQPPLKAPPATLGDADAACQRGDQPACEEASRVRAKALSGGASLPDPPPASAGGAPLKGGQPEQAPPGRPPR